MSNTTEWRVSTDIKVSLVVFEVESFLTENNFTV